MIMIDESRVAQALNAALVLCIAAGSARAGEIATATGLPEGEVGAILTLLARRGALLPRPGGSYARPLVRQVRLPGASYPTGLRAPMAALMGAR